MLPRRVRVRPALCETSSGAEHTEITAPRRTRRASSSLLPWLAATATLFIACLFPAVDALECLVCAESSLDEFGECATQFRYDCTTYARNFPEDERIFCRTTRRKEVNETFTITKECISERDHNRLFPSKGYPLEDECDLLEIAGREIAYCLCREGRCNQKPIAEQFMAFEEKHPELFGEIDGDEDEETEAASEDGDLRAALLPSSAGSTSARHTVTNHVHAHGTLNLAPIMPVNDPRSHHKHPTASNSLRRAQPSFEIEKSTDDDKAFLPSRGLDMLKIHPNAGELPSAIKPANEFSMESPWSVAHGAPQGKSSTMTRGDMRLHCMQCGQGGLEGTGKDCLLQTSYECPLANSLCFTRYITVGSGQNAVEKLCVSHDALLGEYNGVFGEEDFEAAADETRCATTSAGRVRVCVCSSADNCNQRTIDEQMSSAATAGERGSMISGGAKAAGASLMRNRAAAPIELPNKGLAPAEEPTRIVVGEREEGEEEEAREEIDKEERRNANDHLLAGLGSSMTVAEENAPLNLAPIVPSNAHGPAATVPPPITSTTTVAMSTTTGTTTTTGPAVLMPTGLRCGECAATDLSDPTADCNGIAPIACMGATADERVFCMTRQTQLSTGSFAIEKRCVTATEFTTDMPGETAAPGCGTAFDGLVNYCLCAEHLCNKESLLAQAQSHVPMQQRLLVTATTTTRPPSKEIDLRLDASSPFGESPSLAGAAAPVPFPKRAGIQPLPASLPGIGKLPAAAEHELVDMRLMTSPGDDEDQKKKEVSDVDANMIAEPREASESNEDTSSFEAEKRARERQWKSADEQLQQQQPADAAASHGSVNRMTSSFLLLLLTTTVLLVGSTRLL